MAYNKARAEKKWLKWKEAEEKKLRELGVDEETIQRLHTYDRAEFNRERRYLQRQVEWSPYVDMISAQDLELPVEDVESLMDSIEDTILLKTCRNLLRSIPLQGHTVNPAYHLGRFLVHNPVFGIVRVLDVAIGRLSHRLTSIALDFVADAPLLADVTGVPLVEQVADGRQLVLTLSGVDVV